MISCIIFSKDRALQLESLLRSIKENCLTPLADIFVLYRASNQEYFDGYVKVRRKEILPNINWIEEASFKNDLISISNKIDGTSHIMFLVDDNIVFRPFAADELLKNFSKRHLFISLRADMGYNEPTPGFISNQKYLEWRWRSFKKTNKYVTWHYPFSVDGNIFHASDIQRILSEIDFKAPNSLERKMQKRRSAIWLWPKYKALAPLNAVVFNNPLNRVQTEGQTWNAGLSVEDMNRQYLLGKRINNNLLYRANPNAVHYHVDLILEDE